MKMTIPRITARFSLAAFLIFPFLATACNDSNARSNPDKIPGVVAPSVDEPVKKVNGPAAKSLLARQPTTIILDVRTPQEFAAGHLKKARLIDFNAPDFAQKISQLDPTKTYLVYCAVGGRSHLATKLMAQKGFKQIFDATEGFSGLKKAGLATE
jgi:phage shock protein E